MEKTIAKVGVGFRRDIAEEFLHNDTFNPDFIEFAPENWMGMGGYWKKVLDKAAEKYPITCHGLSLSIGSAEPLDYDFLKELKTFFKGYKVKIYSEHLSYTKSRNAHLYDLLPVPFRDDAIKHIVDRIKEVQDILERTIAIENVSYYISPGAQMDEATFVRSIVEEAGCGLLLDVNNIYVNSFNHGYNAKEFIDKMPLNKVSYIHMAGHEKVSDDLIIDTHGQPIIDPVYELFGYTINKMKPVPVLLERDFNFEDFDGIVEEFGKLKSITHKSWEVCHAS
ncbi:MULTISPECIES: HvfB family MNIO-type RiPP peptide maturase [unclassified Saccharicrinis]|uniref:HvfB family MNIO-type RiPP peptide maturase n=1 Tax=unclassified Saccharicrinis TaxID=2646859 RepID=UPI003D326B53